MKKSLFFGCMCLQFCLTIMLASQSCTAQMQDIPVDEVFDVKWVHSHEDSSEDINAYRPESYNFPPSRGRRGFKMLKDKSFINYEIVPTDGIIERKGRWKKENDNTFTILFGKKENHRNYTMEFVSLSKNLLKIKITHN